MSKDHLDDSKKQAIIQAAVEVFAAKGFHQAKMEEIAALAGVGKGTLYAYFASKKELFRDMLIEVTDRYLHSFKESLNGSGQCRKLLQLLLTTNVEFFRRHRNMAAILISDLPPLGEEIRRIFWDKEEECLLSLEQLFQKGQGSGEFRCVNARVAARLIIGVLTAQGSQVLFSDDDQGQGMDKEINEIVDLIMNGIALKPEQGLSR